jgi:phosphoribosyl-ATP pyrophosphohydrolase/phosphoribosyl-AMP cyclohydrolase
VSFERTVAEFDAAALRYDAAGLLPVIAQDAFTGRVLMLAWANAEAVTRTLATGEAHFWSRSRQSLWRKGETSGNTLRVVSIERDCDGDSLLLRVLPAGPACHTGATSCFDADSADGPRAGGLDLGALERIVAARAGADPEASYTARLFAEGIERMAQKVGEEATEVVIAALAAHHAREPEREKTSEGKGSHSGGSRPSGTPPPAPEAQGKADEQNRRLVEEASDLLFHLTVLLQASGVTTTDLANELSARHRDRTQGEEVGSVPLPEKSAELTTPLPEQSEPTDPPSRGKEER